MSDDLNSRVAKVLGYTFLPSHDPAHDINQAVAFAEWACKKIECGFDVIFYDPSRWSKVTRWKVIIANKYQYGHDNLATALCLATLAAMEER